MFDTFFEKYPNYTIIQKPSGDTLSKFNGHLPAQLIQFWDAYGFGTFMSGYLKLVDPMEFQQVFDESYNNKDNEIVFGITGLGDFLTWNFDMEFIWDQPLQDEIERLTKE